MKTSELFETTECSRCGGTGHYSYNQITGTRCFKCGGRCWTFTKRGSAALEAWKAEWRSTKPVTEIVPGDKVMIEHNGRRRALVIEESSIDELNLAQRRWNLRFVYPNALGLGGYGKFMDDEVEVPVAVEVKRDAFLRIAHMPGAVGTWPEVQA